MPDSRSYTTWDTVVMADGQLSGLARDATEYVHGLEGALRELVAAEDAHSEAQDVLLRLSFTLDVNHQEGRARWDSAVAVVDQAATRLDAAWNEARKILDRGN